MSIRILILIPAMATLAVLPWNDARGQSKPAGPSRVSSGSSVSSPRVSKITRLTPQQAQNLRTKIRAEPGKSEFSTMVSQSVRFSGSVNPAITIVSTDIDIVKFSVNATWNGPVTENVMVINRGSHPTAPFRITTVRVDRPGLLGSATFGNCFLIECRDVVYDPYFLDGAPLAPGETRTLTLSIPDNMRIGTPGSCFTVAGLAFGLDNFYLIGPISLCTATKICFEPFSIPTPP
jgi:hypothetical protein